VTRERADLTDCVYERLTVLRRADADDANGARRYLCRCSCGREVEVRGANLTATGKNRVVSCGCYRVEVQRARARLRHLQRHDLRLPARRRHRARSQL